MPEPLDVWREFFRTTNADVFEFIDKAIAIAAADRPNDFRSQRGRIMERLYSCGTRPHAAGDQVGSCDVLSKESKANSNGRGDLPVDMDKESCCSGQAEAFTDEIDGPSQVVGEVLQIKQVLDNSPLESAPALCESLRRLQSMAITLEILEKTKIGISVNSLRRNSGSEQISQLAHSIIGQWKAMVDDDGSKQDDGNCRNTREKNSVILKPKQQLGVVKPSRSSQTDSRTTPSNKIVVEEKFDMERTVELEKPNETSQKDKLKHLQEAAIEIKFEAAKRRIHQRYQREANAKKQRAVQVLDIQHLPKQTASQKTQRSRTEKSCKQRTSGQH